MELGSSRSGGAGGSRQSLILSVAEVYDKLQEKEESFDGFTFQELREEMGWSEKAARAFVRAATDAGLCVAGKKRYLDVSRRVQMIPCYQFTTTPIASPVR